MLRITNTDARRLWLDTNGLYASPTGAIDVLAIIKSLGFVQLDTIQIVARAHHHILWSRNQNYREPMLDQLFHNERAVFEHFTHDASLIPMEFLPMWRRQFARMQAKVSAAKWFGSTDNDGLASEIIARITAEGPLSTREFASDDDRARAMWARPAHKQMLDYLWYAGVLATSHRVNFTKYYDLAERVFPAELRRQELDDQDQIDWLCMSALERLGVATLGEIRKFWDATTVDEVKDWAVRQGNQTIPCEIQSADGRWTQAIAHSGIELKLASLSKPLRRIRIINPFDPATRDRTRLKRLFGFDYTVEMFVPAAKRKWGYYVYPILLGDQFVGRVELKPDRKAGTLSIEKLWTENAKPFSVAQTNLLHAELDRLSRFANLAYDKSSFNGAIENSPIN